MAKKKSDGFQSAAGLIRYFDSEDDKALKINPWFIIGTCAAIIAIVELLRTLYPV
jgi:preprotein translocase subunit Sec61beta